MDRYSDTARQALAAKKWEKAAQPLEHLVRLAPEVSQVHANLGLAYFFEGRPAEALASFEQAQKLNPQLDQIKLMIGLADAELGRCTVAVSVLSPAFEQPSDQDTDRLVGLHLLRCYSQLKQPAKALVAGEALLGRYPKDPEILYQVSRLHAERSSDLMAALLRTAPDSAWMHYANAETSTLPQDPAADATCHRDASGTRVAIHIYASAAQARGTTHQVLKSTQGMAYGSDRFATACLAPLAARSFYRAI